MHNKQSILKPLLAITLFLISISCFSQNPTDSIPDDPGLENISVFTIQPMSFGAFSRTGAGGSVIIGTSGVRTVTGTIVPLNAGISYFNAIFEIEAAAGSLISILNGPNATLAGSNGGTMSVHLDNSEPASPFSTVVAPPGRTQINVGGTLTVGTPASSPPGAYTGTIYITFNQE